MMHPLDTLRAGTAILDPILLRHGFRWTAEQTGKGSGGEFACGQYVRGDRRLELHFRYSLGLVAYHVGEYALDHESYMEVLGVPRGAAQYPGFSDDPLDGFRHLAHDLDAYGAEFLAGDADVLRAVVPVIAQRREAEWHKRVAGYEGDERKRVEARRLFRAGEYARAVAAFESIKYPDLLSSSERATLAIARRRAEGS